MTTPNTPSKTHVLHVELAEIEPAIWRDIVVPSDATLATLHWAIQQAMPWNGGHLHQFEVGRSRFSDPEFEPSEGREGDENQFTLADVLPHVGSRLTYTYDFGDDWVHEVVVLEVGEGDGDQLRCLRGARAAPPDDCGGTPGLVRLVTDPGRDDPEDLRGWLREWRAELARHDDRFAGPYDPEAFDLDRTNAALAELQIWRGGGLNGR